ncbi:MAG: helix-turn-helix domain-containing protein [Gammaproteobacteria bacterium]|nr:helix-turn-helix domain-containing protein [Gammaproteobacteria bacterium]
MFALTEEEVRVLKYLGRELARYRFARNERQADFAAHLGISVPTYRRMERGCDRVPLAYWLRVLSVLDHLKGFKTALGLNSSNLPLHTVNAPFAHRVRRAHA